MADYYVFDMADFVMVDVCGDGDLNDFVMPAAAFKGKHMNSDVIPKIIFAVARCGKVKPTNAADHMHCLLIRHYLFIPRCRVDYVHLLG